MKSILKGNIKLSGAYLINLLNLTDSEKEMVRMWRNHENIRKWMYMDHIISLDEHKHFLEKIKNDNNNFYWVLKDDRNNYLGVLSLNRVNFRNKNAYFAIYSNPYNKIPGVGRIIDRCAIELAFEILKLHTLKLEVIEDNIQVINLHQKMGFKEEGKLKEFVYKNGKWLDVIIMGIVNEGN